MAKLLILFIILNVMPVYSQSSESEKHEFGSHFTGLISRMNPSARLIRVRTDFNNIKFFNRKDRVEFWSDSYPGQKCDGLIEGRTNDYLLIKVSQFETCVRKVHFTTGSFMHFESPDLAETVKMAGELVEVLQKKRLAMQVKKDRHQKELTGHIEKVDAVNKRYEILRQKLEIEWQKELSALEEDKAHIFMEFKNSEARLNEIDTKLESYRIEDHNLKLDRWSLDPALYIKK
jgi:hypothetical protein